MTLNNVRSSPNLAHWCGIWVERGCMTAIIVRFVLTILWEIVISVWEFYMLKSNIYVFFVTSFLCSLQTLMMSYDADGHLHRQFAPVHMMLTKKLNYDLATCVPNFRLIGRQLTILETVKKVNFLWLHVTKKRDFVRRRGLVFPKRISTENILQPTRSLYDVWFKSYGSLCVFHVWGDIDLDLRPFKVIIYVWGQHRPISVYKKNIEHFLCLSFCDMTVP